MHDQLSLTGFDEPVQTPTDRLFFAIFPDADAAAGIAKRASQLRRQHDLKGRPLAPNRFHVTLLHLGDYVGVPQDIVARAKAAAALVAMQSFQVAFDRAMSFSGKPRNRPFVLCGEGGLGPLITFQRTLATVIEKSGLAGRVKSQFTPHVTMLYDDRGVEECPVDTIGWNVQEFVLVHSLLGRTRHIPLARWALSS